MLYCISLRNQRLQLEKVGFQKEIEAYDLDGNPIPPGGDVTCSSIMLLGSKITRALSAGVIPRRGPVPKR